MHQKGWTIVFSACMLAMWAGTSAAQRAGSMPLRSTMAGVYTADQATRGREIYGGRCRSCHTPGTPTPSFKAVWSGRPLSELFAYVSENMPKDNPGELTPEENTLVLAYLLQMLGMPPGREELATDPAALGKIRFDTLTVEETKP